MKGKLIISFDFVDEDEHKIIPESGFNTLITPIVSPVSQKDYYMLKMSLMNFICRYAGGYLSQNLFPPLPREIMLEERHSTEYDKSSQP